MQFTYRHGDGPQRMFMKECCMNICIVQKKNKFKKSGIRPPNFKKKFTYELCTLQTLQSLFLYINNFSLNQLFTRYCKCGAVVDQWIVTRRTKVRAPVASVLRHSTFVEEVRHLRKSVEKLRNFYYNCLHGCRNLFSTPG